MTSTRESIEKPRDVVVIEQPPPSASTVALPPPAEPQQNSAAAEAATGTLLYILIGGIGMLIIGAFAAGFEWIFTVNLRQRISNEPLWASSYIFLFAISIFLRIRDQASCI